MKLPEIAKKLYPKEQWSLQEQRYEQAKNQFAALFDKPHEMILSAPGRSEICGNHTDHNMGKAVGAAITLDILAFVSPRNDKIIRILSNDFPPIEIHAADTTLIEQEKGTSDGLVRGICHKMKQQGYQIGGFDAYTTSQVLKGSGLSSSAAFEVLIVSILDHLYNQATISPKEMAKISQFAENVYFGKASGILDQLSCAYGGMIAIDFEKTEDPKVTPLQFDFSTTDHAMVITDVQSDHADLSADYDAIKSEMQSVAQFFQKEHLRGVTPEEYYAALPRLRQAVSDRALLRAGHYLAENDRVEHLTSVLEQKDFAQFKEIIKESGRSSFMYLQNIYTDRAPTSQAAALALHLTEKLLGEKGAWRIHGGGFGGTIQAYLPSAMAESYIKEMESVFGKGCSFPLQIRPFGSTRIE